MLSDGVLGPHVESHFSLSSSKRLHSRVAVELSKVSSVLFIQIWRLQLYRSTEKLLFFCAIQILWDRDCYNKDEKGRAIGIDV